MTSFSPLPFTLPSGWDILSDPVFEDEQSGCFFSIARARGIPGQKALIFLWSRKHGYELPPSKPSRPSEILCTYCDPHLLNVFSEKDYSALPHAESSVYALQTRRDQIAVPKKEAIRPTGATLGLFANTALGDEKLDPYRLKNNAEFSIRYLKTLEPHGFHVLLRLAPGCSIRSGQEVLLNYGASYLRQLKKDLRLLDADADKVMKEGK